MSDFNPDEYIAQISSPSKGFDPDEYLKEINPPSKVESGVHGFLQGATGGFMDEISGAGEALGRAVGVKGLGGKFSDVELAEPNFDFEKNYLEGRDKKRGIHKDVQKANPGSFTTGNFAGIVASPLNKLAAGQTMAKGGAMLGGLNAAGYSDAKTPQGLLVDTASGAALGGVIGKTAETLSPYADKAKAYLAQKMRGGAERLAAKALGAERGTIKKLGMDKVMRAGGQALDEGVLSAGASTDDLISRNEAVKQKGGELMGRAYDAIDDAGASTFNPLEVASKVDDQLGGFYRSPINKGETRQLENTLDSILMRGQKNIPIRDAQVLKEELGKVANWKNNLVVTDKEKMARDAYRVVSDAIDDAVTRGGEAIDQAGLTDVLRQGKQLFSNASTSGELLANKLAREQGNRMFGLTDTITGAGALGYGGTTGDWETAGALMLAKKGLDRYGSQNMAMGMNKLASVLRASPQFSRLAQQNPQAFGALVSSVFERIQPRKVAGVEQSPDFVREQISDESARNSYIKGN